ncbi:uncharacterized RNA-binding -like [Lecanosticta acicola]|uniref:Uncharacterized RNA-binding -like n=1 Tax=Lecanosticta acicola TaxID=111012 RepID=A0AAI8VVN8_9PEZI|nr:uncharacterized RNA-binding -like [Lecanosticta acicola]
MSQEEATISRKEKKALRDAERRTKDKKRKHVETEESQEPAVGEESAKVESTKKSKKRKAQDDGEGTDAATAQAPAEDAPKPKKRKKTSKTTPTEGEPDDATEKTVKPRFIVFVGNLPYKTTDAALRAHFKKLEPFTLRHRTDPKTKKSKGFAFLEFENYDRMKTVLKLYHHSELDAGRPEEGKEDKRSEKDKKKDTRKINLELTSGGGGNTDARKEKIKGKNVRLEEQRKRRAELEKVEKAKKEKKEGGKPRSEDAKAKPVEEEQAGAGADATQGIHPSRLARIKQ